MTGLTSVTFRQKSIDEIIRLTVQAKLDCIEWGGDTHVPPGNLGLAIRVREKTLAAGLSISSYGSYYYLLANKDPSTAFLPILETAIALQAPTIRVWAGIFPPSKATEEDYINAAKELRIICDMARKKMISIALEYHSDTLTENAKSTKKLLKMANRKNLSTYWQANCKLSIRENEAEVISLLPYLSNIHVYFRGVNGERFPLRACSQYWRECINASHENTGVYLLEFVKDGSEEIFFDDAAFLRSIVPKRNAVFITEEGFDAIHNAYNENTIRILRNHLILKEPIFSVEDFKNNCYSYKNISYIFSAQGMFNFTAEEIEQYFPNLRAIFFAMGTIKDVARPFIESGIHVYSAAFANSLSVAEFTVSQIMLANKGFFTIAGKLRKAAAYNECREFANSMPGNYYGCKVGLIGMGTTGRLVAEMLGKQGIELLAYDPFLSEDTARELGVKKLDLPELFRECQTISNHMENNKRTEGILNYELFSLMKKNACFISTRCTSQIAQDDLVRALRDEPGRIAILDSAFPEPPCEGHPFYEMDNIILTPGVAGSLSGENARMGECMLKAYISESLNVMSPFKIKRKKIQN